MIVLIKSALKILIIVIVFSITSVRNSFATTQTVSLLIAYSPDSIILLTQEKQIRKAKAITKFLNRKREHKKITAIVLAVALGPFGAHRLYLGTATKVPVIYCLTLGGGLGILPFTDIIAIITTKDIGRYENNTKVVMWIKPVE